MKVKRFLSILVIMMVVLCTPIIPLAQTVEQDNLKVNLEVEQVDNNENEVKGKVNVSNMGTSSISGIKVESILPEGLKLKDGSILIKEIGTLQGGESSSYEFKAQIEKSSLVNEDNNNKNNNTPNNKVNLSTNKNTSNALKSSKTGDSNNLIVLISVVVISGGIILFLVLKNKKKSKKILSLFLCLSMVAPWVSSAKLVKAVEVETKEISINEEIKIKDKVYTIKTVVSYEKAVEEDYPSGNVVSRGEWISDLVEVMGFENEQQLEIENEEPFFNDIQGQACENAVNYAVVYSILDRSEEGFRPDEPATREFAALTAVRALAFEPVQDIVCDDVSDITYPKEVETAVAMDIMKLRNNKFYPLQELYESEAEYALNAIKTILNSTEVDPNYNSVIKYKDGVIELEDNTVYSVNGTTVTLELNDETKALKKDDIFVLPDETPYKVVSTTVDGDNIIIETTEPEIEETLDYVDAEGYGTIDMSGFIPAEGVELTQNSEMSLKGVSLVDVEGTIGSNKKISFTINKELNDNTKLKGDFSFSLPSVAYKADIDVGWRGMDINNVYLKFPMSVELDGSLVREGDGDLGGKKDGFIELGKVPVVGIPGIGIYVEIGLAYTVEGKFHIVYSLEGTIGAQVLNNRLRAIKDFSQNFTPAELEATLKVGPKVAGLLEVCSKWDLIDFSLFGGGAADATDTVRDTGMICLDVGFYVFAELSALDEGVIGDWLDIGYTWEIFNKDNSPLKKLWHFEDGSKVPECTYGNGVIKGTVAEANNRTNYIENATISIYNTENGEEKEVKTDANGKYSVALPPGNYKLNISADGYISFECTETLALDEEKYVETYLMVQEGEDGEEGIAGGKITNAVTGGDIEGITLEIRRGWNNTSGEAIKTTSTNEDGKYEVKLPLGNYTVKMIKEGYVTGSYNIYIASGSTLNQNATLVPNSSEMPAGDLRIVLTWDEVPRDLDSHLVGPTADGLGYFHTAYYSKDYSENGVKYADLDLDDTTSYGPETTTVYKMNSTGTYSFYVHDYTNGGDYSSKEMSNSGAKVKVYKGDELIATYNISTNVEGIYWHVFDYNAETNSITSVNRFVEDITYENAYERSFPLLDSPIEDKITK